MSFGALQVLIKEIHMGVRDLVNRKQPEKGILSSFPIVGPGALVQAFGKYLRIHFSESKDWVLMLLLDDCNLLDDNLTKVVNSAVLKAKGIVAYKLTCLTGLYPTRRTLQKDRLVNEHDLETVPVFGGRDGIDMGSPADSKYLKVAEAVCRTKIESACGVQVAKKFDFKQFFGSFQLEDLLIAKLKASENPAAFDLLQMCNDAKQSTSKVSITKIWLHEKNIRKIQVSPASDKDNLWKRRSASIFTTKWKHVAAIAICREYKIAFPYSGWSVILHLSGGSIRELLRIMSKVWTLARVRPDDHSRLRPILPTAQAQAVVRAAEANYDAVDRKFISSEGATLQKMCDRLGSLFGKCQGFPYMIKAPETAAVQLPVRLLTGDESLNSIISEAVTSGVLLKRIQKDTACIGLHPVLAPKYGISFRSPFYYPQTVSISQLRHLVLGSDKDAQVVVREILEERLTRKHQPRNVQPTRSESKQQLELTIADDKD